MGEPMSSMLEVSREVQVLLGAQAKLERAGQVSLEIVSVELKRR